MSCGSQPPGASAPGIWFWSPCGIHLHWQTHTDKLKNKSFKKLRSYLDWRPDRETHPQNSISFFSINRKAQDPPFWGYWFYFSSESFKQSSVITCSIMWKWVMHLRAYVEVDEGFWKLGKLIMKKTTCQRCSRWGNSPCTVNRFLKWSLSMNTPRQCQTAQLWRIWLLSCLGYKMKSFVTWHCELGAFKHVNEHTLAVGCRVCKSGGSTSSSGVPLKKDCVSKMQKCCWKNYTLLDVAYCS